MNLKKLLKNSFLGLALFSGMVAFAQDPNTDHKHCVTDQVMNDWFEKNPSAKLNYQILQQQAKTADSIAFLSGYNRSAQQAPPTTPIFTIPVVFHILHMGGSENISDAQIYDAMSILNTDFQKLNSDTVTVVTQFKNLIGDAQVKFVLASKDPSGNCTNGIIRHVDVHTDWTGTGPEYAYTWPRANYLNIYVVKSITIGSNAAGYTYLPGTSPGANADAIVALHDYVGSIGTSNPNKSRTLTHECGHWFNLPHVWTNASNNQPGVACGDDGVSDTPVTKGNLSCPSSTTAAMICNPGIVENYQNYMDYSYCTHMFTIGQATRMQNALNSSTAQRNNLSTPANLIATGVTNPTLNCAPVADFLSTAVSGYTVCSGQTLNMFKDFSYNAPITNWNWSATNNATIAAPTSSNTTMYFPSPGISVVTLSVSNANGSSTKSRTITVVDAAVTATNGITEGFEGTGTPAGWSVANVSGVQWAQTSNAALEGTKSFMLDGTISSSGQEDHLYMPIMDFAANPNSTLRFSYAYRSKSTTHMDVFKVQLSGDCGGSWKDVYAPSVAVMASGSGGVGTVPYVPASASEWKTVDVSGHPNYFQFTTSNAVMARFYFEEGSGGFGNRLYIDSINLVAAPVGLNELTKHLNLNLSPNPTNSSATLNFVLSNNANVKVSVMDIAGKIVSAQQSYDLNAGDHKIIINENATLRMGIYIVNIDYNGTKMARKLIIE